ncbi:unnamed protein product [Didymodactylos carnosus]|uniref:Uncharacterized protein n=1 Tax=Didymodactylos carnosus TaxID=1234261 RepID=A0A815CM37_9BILA|nr:unnamed protein product [Didymodactylos carnosus]CAF4086466.1 unnamed protein product [Didymodactylos carnosus]
MLPSNKKDGDSFSDTKFDGITMNENKPSEKVLKLLRKNKNMKEWRMHRQELTDEDVKFIAEELKTNKTCESINLSTNNITPEGAAHLAGMLKVNKTLKYLWLASNQIGDRGTEILCTALEYDDNNTSYSVDLSSNQITDQSVDRILKLFGMQNTRVKLFFIDGNQISKENKERLREMAKERNISLGDLF